jgi:hypothetical protein
MNVITMTYNGKKYKVPRTAPEAQAMLRLWKIGFAWFGLKVASVFAFVLLTVSALLDSGKGSLGWGAWVFLTILVLTSAYSFFLKKATKKATAELKTLVETKYSEVK